jgi:hypothetical protein
VFLQICSYHEITHGKPYFSIDSPCIPVKILSVYSYNKSIFHYLKEGNTLHIKQYGDIYHTTSHIAMSLQVTDGHGQLDILLQTMQRNLNFLQNVWTKSAVVLNFIFKNFQYFMVHTVKLILVSHNFRKRQIP